MNRPEYDECECGDFRHQHDEWGCILCRSLGNGTAGVVPPCSGFRLHIKAQPSEVARQDALTEQVKRWRDSWHIYLDTAGDIPMGWA